METTITEVIERIKRTMAWKTVFLPVEVERNLFRIFQPTEDATNANLPVEIKPIIKNKRECPQLHDNNFVLRLYFDGACLPRNPNGIASAGFIIGFDWAKDVLETTLKDFFLFHDLEKLASQGVLAYGLGVITPKGTNNIAEYAGLLAGLMAVETVIGKMQQCIGMRPAESAVKQAHHHPTVLIRGDSELVIYQLQGRYAVHSNNIRPYYLAAMHFIEALKRKNVRVHFKHVYREWNSAADTLSHHAYVMYQEQRNMARLNTITTCSRLNATTWLVNGYTVTIQQKSASKIKERGFVKEQEHSSAFIRPSLFEYACECPHFQRLISYPLHRRSGIRIRCKHLLYVFQHYFIRQKEDK